MMMSLFGLSKHLPQWPFGSMANCFQVAHVQLTFFD